MQPGIKEMLVRRAVNFRRDNATEFRFIAWHHTAGLDNAGQFCFLLDGTVLIQIPVKTIIIVTDGAEKADDQAA